MMATDFKEARLRAGLSVNEAAKLLCVDPVSVRRFEMDPSKQTARPAPPLLIKVLDWFTDQVPPTLAR